MLGLSMLPRLFTNGLLTDGLRIPTTRSLVRLQPYSAGSVLTLLGFWCNHNIAGELSGLSMVLFTRGLGWSAEEVEVFLASVRSDMKDRRIHAWWPM